MNLQHQPCPNSNMEESNFCPASCSQLHHRTPRTDLSSRHLCRQHDRSVRKALWQLSHCQAEIHLPLGVSPLESNQPYQPMPPDIMDRCGFAPHMSCIPLTQNLYDYKRFHPFTLMTGLRCLHICILSHTLYRFTLRFRYCVVHGETRIQHPSCLYIPRSVERFDCDISRHPAIIPCFPV